MSKISKGAACLPVKEMTDNPNKPTICLLEQSTKPYDKSDWYIHCILQIHNGNVLHQCMVLTKVDNCYAWKLAF